MRLWNARRALGKCKEKGRYDSDSVGNMEMSVWARSRDEAITVASLEWGVVPSPALIVVRSTRLDWNWKLYQPPKYARPWDTASETYVGWTHD
jgi:hypothetical protein